MKIALMQALSERNCVRLRVRVLMLALLLASIMGYGQRMRGSFRGVECCRHEDGEREPDSRCPSFRALAFGGATALVKGGIVIEKTRGR